MDIKKTRIKEKTVFKIFKHGTGEIVQWLKALAELGGGGVCPAFGKQRQVDLSEFETSLK